MFKHIVEIDGKFYVRKPSIDGWRVWGVNGFWWTDRYDLYWTAHDTADAARQAVVRRKARFVAFI